MALKRHGLEALQISLSRAACTRWLILNSQGSHTGFILRDDALEVGLRGDAAREKRAAKERHGAHLAGKALNCRSGKSVHFPR
jgi:hypothetical protein